MKNVIKKNSVAELIEDLKKYKNDFLVSATVGIVRKGRRSAVIGMCNGQEEMEEFYNLED